MKHFVFSICIVFSFGTVYAQWEWVKVLPKKHVWIDAKMDSQGNFYLLSNGNWPYHQGPFVIYKLDNQANLVGQKILPENLRVTAIEMRSDDILFLGGYYDSTLSIDAFTITSKGKEDGILIAMNNSLQANAVRNFGGKSGDRVTGVACDRQNRVFIVGGICDTSLVHNETLICNKTGNSFLARFSSNLDLHFVFSDSTHENTHYDHWLSFSSVQVNSNNEILVTGVGQGKDYYSFRGTQFTVTPNYYYHYYRSFIMKLDSSVHVKWHKVHQWSKYDSWQYSGFTNESVAFFYNNGQPGYGFYTEISLNDADGKKLAFNMKPWGMKYSMGVNDNRFYLHRRYEILDTSVHNYVQRNELFAVVDTQAVLIDTVAGGIGSCRLLKSKSGEGYVIGIFLGPVVFGQHTVTTAIDDHKVFIAKLGQSFYVGVKEHGSTFPSITVGPNPSDGRLWLSESLSDVNVYIVTLNGEKFPCRVASNEILLPNLSAGLYLIVIESGKSRATKKIVIY